VKYTALQTIFYLYIPKKDLAKPHSELIFAVSKGNNIFQKELRKYSNNIIEEIYISRLELQRLPFEFLISFLIIYILDLGLRFMLMPFGIMRSF
jgi:hypothetical protein